MTFTRSWDEELELEPVQRFCERGRFHVKDTQWLLGSEDIWHTVDRAKPKIPLLLEFAICKGTVDDLFAHPLDLKKYYIRFAGHPR